jgi:hypothetical protein
VDLHGPRLPGALDDLLVDLRDLTCIDRPERRDGALQLSEGGARLPSQGVPAAQLARRDRFEEGHDRAPFQRLGLGPRGQGTERGQSFLLHSAADRRGETRLQPVEREDRVLGEPAEDVGPHSGVLVGEEPCRDFRRSVSGQRRFSRGGPDLGGGIRGQPGDEVRGGREADSSGGLGGMGAHVDLLGGQGGGRQLQGPGVLARGQGEEGQPPLAPTPLGCPQSDGLGEGIDIIHRPGGGGFEDGEAHTGAGIVEERPEAGAPLGWGRRLAFPDEPGGRTEGLDERSGRGIVEERPERPEVGGLSHDSKRAGGPAAHLGIGIGEQVAQRGEALGQRIAGQGVGGPGMELGIGQGEPALRDPDGRGLLEAEERGEEASPALLLGKGQEGLCHVEHRRLELAQGLHGEDAGLAVIVHHGGEQGGHGLGVFQLAQPERGRPADGGHVVQEEPHQGGAALLVGDPPEGVREGFPQLRPPGERLLDDHRLVLLPVDQIEEQRADVQVEGGSQLGCGRGGGAAGKDVKDAKDRKDGGE